MDEEIGNDRDLEVNNNLHTLRLFVVGELLKDIPNLSIVGGKRAIPYFQVRYIKNMLVIIISFYFIKFKTIIFFYYFSIYH